jgi:hypothetical protein
MDNLLKAHKLAQSSRNNHWRPDNFPLDIQMFTGSVPLEPGSGPHIPTDPSPAGIDEPEGGTESYSAQNT